MCEKPPSRKCQRLLIRKVRKECEYKIPEEEECKQECIHSGEWLEQQEDQQEDEQECGQEEGMRCRLVGVSTNPNGIEFDMEGMDSEECLCTVDESQEFRVMSSFSTVQGRSQYEPEPGYNARELLLQKILVILRILKSWTRAQCRKVQNAITSRQGPQVYYFPCTSDYV